MSSPDNDRAGGAEVFDAVLPFVAGAAVVLPTFPGFLLCVPGFVLVGVVLIPVAVAALALLVVGAVLTPLFLVARAIWRATPRLALVERTRESTGVPTGATRGARGTGLLPLPNAGRHQGAERRAA